MVISKATVVMENWNIPLMPRVKLGYSGENDVCLFEVITEPQEGFTYYLELEPLIEEANNILLTPDYVNGSVYVELTTEMLGSGGIKKAQIVAYIDTEDAPIKKSNIFEVEVDASINATKSVESHYQTALSQWAQILASFNPQEVLAKLQEVEADVDDLEEGVNYVTDLACRLYKYDSPTPTTNPALYPGIREGDLTIASGTMYYAKVVTDQAITWEDLVGSGGGKTDNGYTGKVISILGDSISTFSGYIPVADGHNLTHRARYPQANLLTDVNLTWWKKIIDDLDAKLGINDSWAGSRVSNSSLVNTGDVGPDACMASITRITNLGANGTPDVIFFYGGTNDAGNGVTVGTFDSSQNYTNVDLTSVTWSDFATAYKDAIMRLQHFYPFAKIIVLLPMYTSNYYTISNLDKYNEVIKEICDYFGVTYFDLRACGINYQNIGETLGDGIHPKANGMNLIEKYIKPRLISTYELDAGENIVYTVTNELSNVVNNDRYIKGVSEGNSYNATVTGDVYVYMGGIDITSSVFSNNTITIPSVTGDIVITDSDSIYTITNNLTNCTNSNTATSIEEHGTYTATINHTTSFTSVSITMGGVDVTSAVWDNGTISIPNVTGNIIITIVAETPYVPRETDNSHAQEIPDDATSETNLVTAIGLNNIYYDGSKWSNKIGGSNYNAYSITIPVREGDRIYATSFGAAPGNGSSYVGININGIRTTYFNDNTVVNSVGAADVFSEFDTNGYLTIPSGVNCVCIPVWTNQIENVIKLLTL